MKIAKTTVLNHIAYGNLLDTFCITWKYCIDIELSKMFFFRSDSIRLTQTIRRAMKRKHRQISNDRGFTLCDAPSSSRK